MKTLIDGDGVAYRASAAVEKTKYIVQVPPQEDQLEDVFLRVTSWKEAREIENGTIWSRREVGTLEEAKIICDSFMRRIRESTTDDYSLFLTPSSGNFRDTLAKHTRYKATRDGMVRPVYLADIRDYLCDSYSGKVVKGHEAEDEVSIEATKLSQGSYVVVGNDKDLMQIPGRHYDWVKDEFFDVTPQEALHSLWMQTLMGDRTDNIPGCWGMGFQKAKNRIGCWAKGEMDFSEYSLFMMDLILKEYEKSKKVKGCPYKDESEEDTYIRVYETYWLVKLKQYPDEAIWFPKINKNNKKAELDGTTKARDATSTSSCAQSVGGKEYSSTTQDTGKYASGATG
jgi:hypothetical protein